VRPNEPPLPAVRPAGAGQGRGVLPIGRGSHTGPCPRHEYSTRFSLARRRARVGDFWHARRFCLSYVAAAAPRLHWQRGQQVYCSWPSLTADFKRGRNTLAMITIRTCGRSSASADRVFLSRPRRPLYSLICPRNILIFFCTLVPSSYPRSYIVPTRFVKLTAVLTGSESSERSACR